MSAKTKDQPRQKLLLNFAQRYVKQHQPEQHTFRNTLLVATPIAAASTSTIFFLRRPRTAERLLRRLRHQLQKAEQRVMFMKPRDRLYPVTQPIQDDLVRWLGTGKELLGRMEQHAHQLAATGAQSYETSNGLDIPATTA